MLTDTDDKGKLMLDFRCTNASDTYFSALADRVRFFKNEEGRKNMGRLFEEIYDEAVHDRDMEIALEMLKDGLDVQTIAKYLKLSPEEVKELAQKESA